VTSNESQEENADIDARLSLLDTDQRAEYGWDDYKGVDLKGKVALLFVNEPISDHPNFFKGKALTYYGRWPNKFEETARRRGVGHTDHPPDGLGKLRLGRGPDSWGQRKVVSEAGWFAETASGFVDSRRSGEKLVAAAGLDLAGL